MCILFHSVIYALVTTRAQEEQAARLLSRIRLILIVSISQTQAACRALLSRIQLILITSHLPYAAGSGCMSDLPDTNCVPCLTQWFQLLLICRTPIPPPLVPETIGVQSRLAMFLAKGSRDDQVYGPLHSAWALLSTAETDAIDVT